jgi:hypothetical protein
MAGYVITILAGIELNTDKNVAQLLKEEQTLSSKYICKTSMLSGLQYIGIPISPPHFIELELSEISSLANKYSKEITGDPELSQFIQKLDVRSPKFRVIIFDNQFIC